MEKETRSIQLPFCGFYESDASHMIDQEIEQAFSDENGDCLNVPEETYFKKEYCIDNKAIEIELVKAYVDAYEAQYESETGILLNATFEEMTSPREYNFSTDRVFITVPLATVKKLYAQSRKDKHVELAKVIKDQCTIYSGFISFYSNDLTDWLAKGFLAWDHNELKILLQAVLNIHNSEADFNMCDLLESWTCNGGLSNAVWGAIPAIVQEFAEVQRDYGKAVDFEAWVRTGVAYENGSDEALPPPRCKETMELPL
jgi:hypothetical protein